MAEKLRHKVHHASCPKAQAWDIDNVPCSCPRGWPRTPYTMPLPADVAADEISALRAKLEQAETAYAELNVRLAGVEAERDHYRTTMMAVRAQRDAYADDRDRLQRVVDNLSHWHLCPDHQPDKWESDGTCPLCEGEKLKRVVDDLLGWANYLNNDKIYGRDVKVKLGALLREK